MKRFIDEQVEEYARSHTQPETGLLLALAEETWQSTDLPQMLSGRLSGRFLKMLVQLTRARFAVEVGMFTGYSALSIAEGLPEEGRLLTCDTNPNYAKVARRYFDQSRHGKKIDIALGPASETLSGLNTEIDFAFVDADKVNYDTYYETLLEKMTQGGLIVLDNCLWSGEVLNPKDESSQALHALNEKISRDDRVENVILTVRDGLNLIRKK